MFLAACCLKMTRQSTPARFLLVYGTQTGQAKAICEEIVERSTRIGLNPDIHCFGRIEKEFTLENESLVVIVTSTTGDGEPPDTVQKFWRRIKRKTLPKDHFGRLQYALLGLGDSNYSNFCNCPKMVDARLQELGAKHFMPTGFADDATGLELVAEPWIESLLMTLCKHFNLPTPSSTDLAFTPNTKVQLPDKTSLEQETSKLSLNGESAADSMATVTVASTTATTTTTTTTTTTESVVKVNESRLDPSSWVNDIHIKDESDLSLPMPPVRYLCVEPCTGDQVTNGSAVQNSNNSKLPFAGSPIYKLPILDIRRLTREDAVKCTLEVTLDSSAFEGYQSGDTIALIAENDHQEVDWLIQRLELSAPDQLISVNVDPQTTKKKPVVPEYLNNPSSIRQLLTYCIDIRFTPKKAVLALLAGFCSDEVDRRQLLMLSSKEGADCYQRLVMEAQRGLLHILSAFKSCKPAVDVLLEISPRLLPRAYSICSASNSPRLKFAFNVIDLPPFDNLAERRGLVTGHFSRLFNAVERPQVQLYLRNQFNFRLPTDSGIPLIFIGPGTGLAPFLGFLEDRQKLLEDGQTLGPCHLFFGNRHKDRDYLYRDDLERHLATGALSHLHVTFSRDVNDDVTAPRYVTGLMEQQASSLADLIVDQAANVYVCGDAKSMSKNVNEALCGILQHCKGMTEVESISYVKQMRKDKRYREDVWT